jgi:hypothetical protein
MNYRAIVRTSHASFREAKDSLSGQRKGGGMPNVTENVTAGVSAKSAQRRAAIPPPHFIKALNEVI